MKVSIFNLVLLLFVSSAHAADIDGKWEGTLPGKDGGQPRILSYDFKADGKKLTGTMVDSQGAKIEIKNGKIDGNNISFDVPIEINDMKLTHAYTGILSGDELKLSFRMEIHLPDGGSFAFGALGKADGENEGQQGDSYSYRKVQDDSQVPKTEFTAKHVNPERP